MTWKSGTELYRHDDGVVGHAHLEDDGRLVVYFKQHGQQLIDSVQTGMRERWVPVIQQAPLRPEERVWVGRVADAALRSVREGSPLRWWELWRLREGEHTPFDPELVRLVDEHLRARDGH